MKPQLRPVQKPHTKGQIRLVSSIQEAIRLKEKSEKGKDLPNFPRKTHAPGGISVKVLGVICIFVQKFSIFKSFQSTSKPRKPASSSKIKPHAIVPNIDSDRNILEKEDYDVMKSAIRMTELVMEDLKQTMRIGNNEHLVLGVGK